MNSIHQATTAPSAFAFAGWLRARALRGARGMAWWIQLLALCWFSGAAHDAAAAPPSGTMISSTAYISYTVPATSQTWTNYPSNTVVFFVSQIAAMSLTTSQVKTSAPNAPVVFAHTLTNLGNGTDSFDLSFVNPSATCGTCGFTLLNVQIYPDIAPADGIADGAAPVAGPIVLAAGASYTFVATTLVPTTAVAGQDAKIDIRAVGNAAAATAGGYVAAVQQTNNDIVRVTSAGVLNPLGKAFSVTQGPSPGLANVTVTITYSNNTPTAVTNVVIQDWIGKVNGAPILDTTGFTYVAGSARWSACNGGATALTDASDGNECGPVGQLIDYQFNATAATGSPNVIANIQSVPAFTSGQLSFQVTVNAALAAGMAKTTNAARIRFFDSAANQIADTNQATYNVVAVSGVDLTMTKTVTTPATGGFSVNNTGEYTLQVSNVGVQASSGVITVTDTLPGGLEVTGFNASGWACSQTGSHTTGNVTGGGVSITCTSSAVLPAQASTVPGLATPIRVQVVPRLVGNNLGTVPFPAVTAAPNRVTVTNTARVDGGNEPAFNNGNNTGTVVTAVGPVASIKGRVWQDINHNRLFNVATDSPLANWTIEVIDPATTTATGGTFVGGTVIKRATTDASGLYAVGDLRAGTYLIQFRDPANNVVNGRPVCDDTAAAAPGTAGTGSYVQANCNTPAFRGPTDAILGPSPGAVKSVLAVNGRYLQVTLQGGETILNQSLPLDPSGIVYNANTGQPVTGAVVNMLPPRDQASAGLALVAGYDPATWWVGGAASFTTSGNGFYQFLLTAVGQAACTAAPGGSCIFSLQVTPPAGYQPWANALAAFPPTPSNGGGCPAAPVVAIPPAIGNHSCRDPAGPLNGSPGGAPYLMSATNTPVIPNTSIYALRFLLNGASPDIVNNHFPLVLIGAGGATNLLVSKTVNKATAEIGDFVDYTVRVLNGTAGVANNVKVTDTLPAGFKYVPGTARLTVPPATTASAIPDPAGGAGPTLVFPVGVVTAGNTVTLTYRAQLSINAGQGDGINRASASAPGFGSNVAIARVRVTGGVFSDRGFIVGTVFADCNRDRVQGPREPGIPGVRLYMEDGTSVVTDSEGKFSLYGVSPRTHVMKIDDITLPIGSELISLSNRNAGDPSSRFVDVKKGELARADFAEGSCSPEVLAQIKGRREKGETGLAELNRAYGGALAASAAAPVAPGAIGAAAAGVGVGGSAQAAIAAATGVAAAANVIPSVFNPVKADGAVGSINSSNSNLPPRNGDMTDAQLPDVSHPALTTKPLEDLLPDADNQFAILNLRDGDTLPYAITNVQIKGAAGAKFVLTVNGVEVPESRIGKRSVLESKSIQGWEYIGVTLNAGENVISARQVDSFGNVRGTATLKVIAPGQMAKIVIESADSGIADGATAVTVKVRLVDAKGVLVTSRTGITLESSLGLWQVRDLNPLEPGTQVFISGGVGEFKLIPPTTPGEATLAVSGGVLRGTKPISFLPHLRPLIGAGIIEGAFNFNNLSLKNINPVRERDSFEQEIRRFHYESSNGKGSAGARSAMFLKGKVKGEYLLTLAYDSDKDLRERVFRDISPDEFYPIYGDSSSRSFDAQTSGRFYVRVDKEKSFLLYGDYATASAPGARALSQFSRSLTGGKWHLEGKPYSVNSFISRDTFKQLVQEFRANGTSGPFLLNLPSGSVINSERVEVLTRDRNQPALILATAAKGRFSDYEIETYTGRLLFHSPVAALDANLNPQSIRIIYELDQGGTPFWIGGVDGQYKVTDTLEVGGSYVKDQNPGQEFSMAGVNATWKIFEKTVLQVESARTNRNAAALTGGPGIGGTAGSGIANRFEIRHSDGPIDARVYAGRAGTNFDNPSSSLARGRMEAGGRVGYKLTPTTTLNVEAIRTGDVATGATRDAVQLRADHAFSGGIRVEAGLRHSVEKTPAAADANGVTGASVGTTPNQFTSVLAKVTAPVPGLPQASVNASYEQSIQGDDRKAIGLGADYKLSPSTRLYGRFETISSLTGPNGLSAAQKNNTAVFGIDTKVTESTQVFTEYRGRSSLDGATAEASMGVRNTWAVAPGLRVTGTLEHLAPVQKLANSTTSNQSTAVTGGVEYTANPLWKGSARLELRTSDASDSVFNTLSLAYKVSRDWALLAKSNYSITNVKGATPGDQERWRVQVGAAYRDTDSNKLSALSRYEHREETDTVASPILKRSADIASFHFNYQANRSSVLSGRYATKYVSEDSLGIASKSSGHLISGRLTHDITSKWDVGLTSSLHTDGGFANRKLGLGMEVGYLLQENLWLSGGYNIFGFKDKDLAGQDFTDKGFYIRLRYKFDETLFDWSRDAKLRNGAAAEQK